MLNKPAAARGQSIHTAANRKLPMSSAFQKHSARKGTSRSPWRPSQDVSATIYIYTHIYTYAYTIYLSIHMLSLYIYVYVYVIHIYRERERARNVTYVYIVLTYRRATLEVPARVPRVLQQVPGTLLGRRQQGIIAPKLGLA